MLSHNAFIAHELEAVHRYQTDCWKRLNHAPRFSVDVSQHLPLASTRPARSSYLPAFTHACLLRAPPHRFLELVHPAARFPAAVPSRSASRHPSRRSKASAMQLRLPAPASASRSSAGASGSPSPSPEAASYACRRSTGRRFTASDGLGSRQDGHRPAACSWPNPGRHDASDHGGPAEQSLRARPAKGKRRRRLPAAGGEPPHPGPTRHRQGRTWRAGA